MSKIRINDLARELEVKSKAVLDYLQEIGISDKRSHSSALDDDVAEKVRQHFRSENGDGARQAALHATEAPASKPEVSTAPSQAAGPAAHASGSAKKSFEFHVEPRAMTRSLDEIREAARKAVAAPPPPPPTAARPIERHAEKLPPGASAGPVSAPPAAVQRPDQPLAPATRVPGRAAQYPQAPAATLHEARPSASPETGLRPAPAAEPAAPPRVTELSPSTAVGRQVRPARPAKSPASNQPIYPGLISPKGIPSRPPGPRGTHEPRPQHPTASRPVPAGGGAHAVATGAPATRPPAHRFTPPPASRTQRPPMMPPRPTTPVEVPITRNITITEGISIKELSEKLETRAKDVIKRLLDKGIFATINQTLDSQTAIEIARNFGADASVITYEEEVLQDVEETDRPEDLKERAPVVTVMGHVDHGKTSLLDAIRETNVTAREAGGITQHIGAYRVDVNARKIVFLDTPGHEAFTLMRARGAKVTDIVVLVVAADDGVMPQTLEAINHARAAKVPIIVAVNKIDKPDAQPDRVKRQLADHGLMPEEWGGDAVTVEVSAKQHTNLGLLLEMILLVADLQQVKANPSPAGNGHGTRRPVGPRPRSRGNDSGSERHITGRRLVHRRGDFRQGSRDV